MEDKLPELPELPDLEDLGKPKTCFVSYEYNIRTGKGIYDNKTKHGYLLIKAHDVDEAVALTMDEEPKLKQLLATIEKQFRWGPSLYSIYEIKNNEIDYCNPVYGFMRKGN